MRLASVSVLFPALLLPLAAGCNGLFMVSHERSFDFTHPFTAGDALDVKMSNGSITVRVAPGGKDIVAKGRIVARAGSPEAAQQLADDSEVTIEAEAASNSASSSSKAKTWIIRLQKPQDRLGADVSASVELTLPGAMALQLESTNGAIVVRSNSAAVAAKTSNGRIEITDQTGDVQAVTSNGRIEIRSLAGAVDCRTSNGGVDILARPAENERVVARTSNGSIDVQLPTLQSAAVWARTSNGKVRFLRSGKTIENPSAAANENDAKLRLNTSNGSITVHYEPTK